MSFEQVRAIEWIARRAPSPHNTQPWRLDYGKIQIALGFDATRHLVASDPNKRDLLLSLGCFIEAFLIAAHEAGVGLQFVPDVDLNSSRVGWFEAARIPYDTPFTSSDVINRQTSRLPYRAVHFDDLFRKRLEACLSQGDRMVYMRGADIADLIAPADRHLLDAPLVAAEFRRWSRLTLAEAAISEDGLTADCLALSRLEARVLALLLSDCIYPWFRRLKLSWIAVLAGRSIVREDTQVLAIVRQNIEPLDAINAGRSLMRLWLMLSSAGLYAHPLSQLLDCAHTYSRLSSRAGLVAREEIICLFRFGASQRPERSRRLGETSNCASREG